MRIAPRAKPGFSGEWQLNLQASQLSPVVAPAAQSGLLRIDHRDPSFKCQMTIVLGGQTIDKAFEMQSDGREVTATHEGVRIASNMRWDDGALLATWQIDGAHGAMTMVWRYELQDHGRRLRASEQLRAQGRDQDNVWVFDRS